MARKKKDANVRYPRGLLNYVDDADNLDGLEYVQGSTPTRMLGKLIGKSLTPNLANEFRGRKLVGEVISITNHNKDPASAVAPSRQGEYADGNILIIKVNVPELSVMPQIDTPGRIIPGFINIMEQLTPSFSATTEAMQHPPPAVGSLVYVTFHDTNRPSEGGYYHGPVDNKPTFNGVPVQDTNKPAKNHFNPPCPPGFLCDAPTGDPILFEGNSWGFSAVSSSPQQSLLTKSMSTNIASAGGFLYPVGPGIIVNNFNQETANKYGMQTPISVRKKMQNVGLKYLVLEVVEFGSSGKSKMQTESFLKPYVEELNKFGITVYFSFKFMPECFNSLGQEPTNVELFKNQNKDLRKALDLVTNCSAQGVIAKVYPVSTTNIGWNPDIAEQVNKLMSDFSRTSNTTYGAIMPAFLKQFGKMFIYDEDSGTGIYQQFSLPHFIMMEFNSNTQNATDQIVSAFKNQNIQAYNDPEYSPTYGTDTPSGVAQSQDSGQPVLIPTISLGGRGYESNINGQTNQEPNKEKPPTHFIREAGVYTKSQTVFNNKQGKNLRALGYRHWEDAEYGDANQGYKKWNWISSRWDAIRSAHGIVEGLPESVDEANQKNMSVWRNPTTGHIAILPVQRSTLNKTGRSKPVIPLIPTTGSIPPGEQPVGSEDCPGKKDAPGVPDAGTPPDQPADPTPATPATPTPATPATPTPATPATPEPKTPPSVPSAPTGSTKPSNPNLSPQPTYSGAVPLDGQNSAKRCARGYKSLYSDFQKKEGAKAKSKYGRFHIPKNKRGIVKGTTAVQNGVFEMYSNTGMAPVPKPDGWGFTNDNKAPSADNYQVTKGTGQGLKWKFQDKWRGINITYYKAGSGGAVTGEKRLQMAHDMATNPDKAVEGMQTWYSNPGNMYGGCIVGQANRNFLHEFRTIFEVACRVSGYIPGNVNRWKLESAYEKAKKKGFKGKKNKPWKKTKNGFSVGGAKRIIGWVPKGVVKKGNTPSKSWYMSMWGKVSQAMVAVNTGTPDKKMNEIKKTKKWNKTLEYGGKKFVFSGEQTATQYLTTFNKAADYYRKNIRPKLPSGKYQYKYSMHATGCAFDIAPTENWLPTLSTTGTKNLKGLMYSFASPNVWRITGGILMKGNSYWGEGNPYGIKDKKEFKNALKVNKLGKGNVVKVAEPNKAGNKLILTKEGAKLFAEVVEDISYGMWSKWKDKGFDFDEGDAFPSFNPSASKIMNFNMASSISGKGYIFAWKKGRAKKKYINAGQVEPEATSKKDLGAVYAIKQHIPQSAVRQFPAFWQTFVRAGWSWGGWFSGSAFKDDHHFSRKQPSNSIRKAIAGNPGYKFQYWTGTGVADFKPVDIFDLKTGKKVPSPTKTLLPVKKSSKGNFVAYHPAWDRRHDSNFIYIHGLGNFARDTNSPLMSAAAQNIYSAGQSKTAVDVTQLIDLASEAEFVGQAASDLAELADTEREIWAKRLANYEHKYSRK